MQIEKALDAGPLFALTHHPLSSDETGASLSKTLARIGSASLIEVLRDWSDLPKPSPQDHQRATYAYKLTPADSLISWTTPAVDIERIVRALSDRSAAYTTLGDNRIRILKVKVLEGSANPGELVKTNEGFAIGCADGLVLLDTVQLNRGQGKPMSADDAANGHADLFSTGIQYDVIG